MKTEYFSKNINGIDYVVGDIHGKFTQLEQHLEEIGFNGDVDRLFCVGDLIDKGKENSRSIEFLLKSWFHTVMGNHEEMALLVAADSFQLTKLILAMKANAEVNGNQWFLDLPNKIQRLYASMFVQLPMLIEIEGPNNTKIGIAHAEIPSVSWNEMVESNNERDIRTVLWGRELAKMHRDQGISWFRSVEGIDLVIHGHSVVRKPVKLGNRLLIDTGAYGDFTIWSLQECLDFK